MNFRSFWDLLPGPWRFWLDGGHFTHFAWGEPPWIFEGKDGQGAIHRPDRLTTFSFTDPVQVLKNLLSEKSVGARDRPLRALGYWSYECGHYFLPVRRPLKTGPFPDCIWVLPRWWAEVDHGRGTVEVFGRGEEPEEARRRWTEKLLTALEGEKKSVARPGKASGAAARPGPARDRAWYVKTAGRVQGFIAAGDIYQANLSRELKLPWNKSRRAGDFFDVLRQINPAPYACLMEFPRFTLAGCSPELLLRVSGDRVLTRPIAGTRPRGTSAAGDEKLSRELLLSEKERAEHIMLVDLERNDLGRVCRPGTVRVSERYALEKYSHVTHIVSQVEGRLMPGRDGFDAFRALFPGGTITGCPKIRCMEILRDLERAPRGPFYGSAGWAAAGGDMALNILIRTAAIQKNELSLRVGAGIVADSVPAREYEETSHKAGALLAAHRAVTKR